MTESNHHDIPARPLGVAPPIQLQPEEPAVTAWQASPRTAFVDHLMARAGAHAGRPAIIAIDGRSGSGKTTLTAALASVVPGAQVLHLDDLIWNEPLYQWDQQLVAALSELHTTGALDLIPHPWREHGREGSIRITAGAPLVIVEGTGAGLQAVRRLIDLHVWVQTGDDVAEHRGISRDIAEGTNGNAEESVRFWHAWMAAERPFFAADRPWERADMIVSGQAQPGLCHNEIAWSEAAACPVTPRVSPGQTDPKADSPKRSANEWHLLA